MGIAGGSVTDWRDYDTIYTERYMLMPQNNPEGYRRSSPRFAAADLSGALLLVHGTMDENVHMQNTLQFAYALQQAGKQFDMMLYPRSRHRLRRHGPGAPPPRRHARLHPPPPAPREQRPPPRERQPVERQAGGALRAVGFKRCRVYRSTRAERASIRVCQPRPPALK